MTYKYSKTIDTIIKEAGRILGEGHAIYDNEGQEEELVNYLKEQYNQFFEKFREENYDIREQVAKDILSFFLKTEGKLMSEIDTSKEVVRLDNGEIYINLDVKMKELYDDYLNVILNS